MKITIECFGTFRNFGDKIELSLETGQSVCDIRRSLMTELQKIDAGFQDEELLSRSRFASQTSVLPENTKLENGMVLAVIPPVSGG